MGDDNSLCNGCTEGNGIGRLRWQQKQLRQLATVEARATSMATMVLVTIALIALAIAIFFTCNIIANATAPVVDVANAFVSV